MARTATRTATAADFSSSAPRSPRLQVTAVRGPDWRAEFDEKMAEQRRRSQRAGTMKI
jgi:hypothetical protein